MKTTRREFLVATLATATSLVLTLHEADAAPKSVTHRFVLDQPMSIAQFLNQLGYSVEPDPRYVDVIMVLNHESLSRPLAGNPIAAKREHLYAYLNGKPVQMNDPNALNNVTLQYRDVIRISRERYNRGKARRGLQREPRL